MPGQGEGNNRPEEKASKKWFESLKEAMKRHGFDTDAKQCSLYLNDMSQDPVPALYSGGLNVGLTKGQRFAKGMVSFNSMSDEQIEHLYILAKNRNLTLTPVTGDFKDICRLTVGSDGTCKVSRAFSRMDEPVENKFFRENEDKDFIAERNWKQSVLAEMQRHPEYYSSPELAGERADMHIKAATPDEVDPDKEDYIHAVEKEPLGRNLKVEETLTDIYKESQKGDVKLEELLSAGLIRDENGMMYTGDSKPWENLDRITSGIENGKPLFAVSVDGTKAYKVDFQKEPPVDLKNPEPKKLVDPKVKADAVKSLEDVIKRFDGLKSKKNQYDIDEFKATCEFTLSEMKKNPYKAEFDGLLKDLSDLARDKVRENVTKKASKTKMALLDISMDIRSISKNASKDKIPSEHALSKQDKQRLIIANKSVLTLAKMGAKSANEDFRELSNRILDDPDTLDKQVDEHMNSAEFKELYGDSRHPGDDKLVAGASISASKNLVKVYKEKKAATDEVRERSDQARQSRKRTMGNNRVSPEAKDDLADQIARIKQSLDKLGYEQRASQEFRNFKSVLDMTHIRLQRGNSYMNVKKQMTELAEAADKYYLTKVGKDFNDKGYERFRAASDIRHMADALAQDKMPSENMPSEEDLIREDIAAKLVSYSAEKKRATGKPEDKVIADRMMNNPRFFRRNIEVVLEDPAFKALYADADIKKLSEALRKEPVELNKALSVQSKKLKAQEKIKARDEIKVEKDGVLGK